MKVTKVIASVCTVVLATTMLAGLTGCNSKGENKSKDYHENDMERMDKKSKRHAGKGTYSDK